jgi:hypothetical protein
VFEAIVQSLCVLWAWYYEWISCVWSSHRTAVSTVALCQALEWTFQISDAVLFQMSPKNKEADDFDIVCESKEKIRDRKLGGVDDGNSPSYPRLAQACLQTDPCTNFVLGRKKLHAHLSRKTTTMARTSKTVEKPRDLPTADSAKKHDYDLSDSENDAQLQLLKQKGPQWEGFGDENIEDDDEDEDDDDDDDDDDESVDVKMDQDDDVPEKDDSEEELERLVFGDTAGFREGLRSFALEPAGAALNSETDEEADEEGLGNVADKDLFFFDSGPGVAPAGALPVAQDGEDEEEGDKPAWGDSDDEKLVVSLASVPRLRKLRETEADDVVSGREYVRRLRKQYQRLYPTPDWALQATGKLKRKRTRTAEEGESEEESASDMDVDDDDLSTQPLARLLKDADILSRVSNGPAKRRKLQAGTVSIQRLKDVSSKGPVCALFHLSRDMLTHTSSLPLPRFLSTLRILYCFHLGRARLCPCITSSAPPLPLPPSTPRLLTLASSSARVVVISTSGIYRRAR